MNEAPEMLEQEVAPLTAEQTQSIADFVNSIAKMMQRMADDLCKTRQESQRLQEAIQQTIDIIPDSMGGQVTLGLNILHNALRYEAKP
jgi:hypothetical protein